MDEMSASGSGELSKNGPVLNPHNPAYLAGGSSSGAAAAVVNGDVDIAIGGDQGGSIRSPAAQCGCVGLKPSYGLVPHTGVFGLAPSLDHVGPLARSVRDCARAFEVIAGNDGRDPRQLGITNTPALSNISLSTPRPRSPSVSSRRHSSGKMRTRT